jgi:hypothetical protein
MDGSHPATTVSLRNYLNEVVQRGKLVVVEDDLSGPFSQAIIAHHRHVLRNGLRQIGGFFGAIGDGSVGDRGDTIGRQEGADIRQIGKVALPVGRPELGVTMEQVTGGVLYASPVGAKGIEHPELAAAMLYTHGSIGDDQIEG